MTKLIRYAIPLIALALFGSDVCEVLGSPSATPTVQTGPPVEQRLASSDTSWIVQRDQLGAQTTEGTFAIKNVIVVGSHILFPYAMHVAQPAPPQVVATTSNTDCAPGVAPTPATVSVSDFGLLQGDAIGIIAVSWTDQPGQVITLDIAPPGAPMPVWHLSPTRQLSPFPSGSSLIFGVDFTTLPEVAVGTRSGRGVLGGWFATQDASDASGAHYSPRAYFLADAQGNAQQVSDAQYAATNDNTGAAIGTAAPYTVPLSVFPTPTVPGGAPPAPAMPAICAQ